MAAVIKSLARNNKSRSGTGATNGHDHAAHVFDRAFNFKGR
jgi:hypothetical protein